MLKRIINAFLPKKPSGFDIQQEGFTSKGFAEFFEELVSEELTYPQKKVSKGKKVVVLEVPYHEKDKAKALGARWDPEIKKWFIDADDNQARFAKWLNIGSKPRRLLTLGTIPYLLRSWRECYKCGNMADVFCLASSGLRDEEGRLRHGFHTFSNLVFVPEKLRIFLEKNADTYYPSYSKTAGIKYFLNHCDCGAKLGDFFMHCEPRGAFFPTSIEEADKITMHWINAFEPLKIAADYHVQEPDFFHSGARRGINLFLEE